VQRQQRNVGGSQKRHILTIDMHLPVFLSCVIAHAQILTTYLLAVADNACTVAL